MNDRPSKSVNREFSRNRAKGCDMKIILHRRDGMLLKQPAVLRYHASCRLELRRGGIVAAHSFAKAGYAKQIVTYRATSLAEVVGDARLDILRRVRGEKRPHANRQFVLAPQLERVFLILDVARVDDTGESETIRMGVQVKGSTQLVFRCLCRLKRGQS